MTPKNPVHEEPIKKKNTLLAKIVIGLILFAFVFTGVQSYLTSHSNAPVVAQVGKSKIHQHTLQAHLQQALKNVQNPEMIPLILSETFVTQVLETLIRQGALQQEIQELKLVIPDDLLKSFIRHTPDLDPEKLKEYIQQSGQTEKSFMASLRADMSQEQLSAALFSGLSLPKVLQEAFIKAENTLRSVRVITYDDKTVTGIPLPSERDLKSYYEKNKDTFKVPEKRSFSVLKITPSAVTVTDKEAKDYYTKNTSQFQSSETRNIAVLTLKKDETYNATAPETYKKRFINLGPVSQEMIETAVASQIFSLEEGAYSPPINTEEGRKVYWVQKITPAKPLSFDLVKEQIIKGLKSKKQAAEQKNLIQKIDDAIGGGEEFASIAQTYPNASVIPYEKLTEENTKKTLGKDLAQEIFTQQLNEESPLHATPQGTLQAIKVGTIEKAHVPEFDLIKRTAKDASIKEIKIKEAQKSAKLAAEALNRKEALSVKVPTETLKDQALSPLNSKLGLSQKEFLSLAHLKEGQALFIPTSDGGKVIHITRLKDAPSPDKKTLKALNKILVRMVTQNYQNAFFEALKKKYTVSIDQKVVKETLEKLQEQYQQ